MQNHFKNLSFLLGSSNPLLKAVLNKAFLLNKINQLFISLLPSTLSSYCQVANLHESCLIVQVQNSAIATLFRYQIPELLEKLRNEKGFPNIASIRCTIKPPQLTESATVASKALKPSPETSRIIAQTAKAITDKKLARALFRLSENIEAKSSMSS